MLNLLCIIIITFSNDQINKTDFLKIHNHCEICKSYHNLKIFKIDENNNNPHDWCNYITLCSNSKYNFNCYELAKDNPYIWQDIITINQIIANNKNQSKLKLNSELKEYIKSIKIRIKTHNELNIFFVRK